MTNPLKQSYREQVSGKSKLYTIIFFSLFIFVFLFLFKPFGLSLLEPEKQLPITLGFGVVTAFVLIVFKFLIEPQITGAKWTLWKSILWDLLIALCIGVANYFYISIVFNIGFNFKYLMFAIWTAILVGSIPVTISHILFYNRIYRNALDKADIKVKDIFPDSEIRLTAGYEKNEIKINPDHIIFICSNDNYITIASLKDGNVRKETVRGTLKAVEHELRKNKMFVRCHKCYIVNLRYADRVLGHSQNMKIKLFHTDELIPVSRSKAGDIISVHP